MLTKKRVKKRAQTRTKKIQQCYIFGYGSLVNDISRQNTLGHYSKAIPVIVAKGFGYRRKYTYIGDPTGTNHAINVLGVEKCKTQTDATPINGVIFKLTVGEVRKFDKREQPQVKVQIPWEYIKPYSPKNFKVNKSIPIYIYKMCKHVKVEYDGFTPSQSYIDTTVNGLDKHGTKMAKMFFKTTKGLPMHMNTYKKWKKNIKTRITEYLISAHYGKRY